ncbi:retron St85 family RNA-directed DNA polymerase [Piscinibacter sp. XHJ-5]|uniref:retron St85 family RNA-directed DNA polymerase n=1 Tax=Piscinibacter sp. XHJ-5 TaxID=3037797 RepID=UPI002452D964|nr:retron St85 family RNA-directed DNA polymerase [Piscinibacter sp. XHJ-5]
MIVQQMSNALGLPEAHILSIAHAASHSYKQYAIKKHGGGTRTIFHPARPLKALQRWLLREVVAKWPVHPAAMAYRRGISILDNASVHRESKFLLRMDFADFFASITAADLKRYIQDHPALFSDWSNDDTVLFCNLAFRFGSLTIGAPTSPAIANAVCQDMDVQLSGLCSKHQVNYTRYADDLFFSTKQPNILGALEIEVSSIIANLATPAGLVLNSAKTRHSSKKGARRVTGIVLGSDGNTYIGRQLKRRIRAMLHTYGGLSVEERATLAGLLAYASGFDPDFKNSLIDKYGLAVVQKASNVGKQPSP